MRKTGGLKENEVYLDIKTSQGLYGSLSPSSIILYMASFTQ